MTSLRALLALVSFTLFGTAYWAPYVGNGLTLALYVWCVRQAMSNLKESWTVLLLAAFLALPHRLFLTEEALYAGESAEGVLKEALRKGGIP